MVCGTERRFRNSSIVDCWNEAIDQAESRLRLGLMAFLGKQFRNSAPSPERASAFDPGWNYRSVRAFGVGLPFGGGFGWNQVVLN